MSELVNNGPLRNSEVLEEGFRPLRRAPTEPVNLTSSQTKMYNKNFSFNAVTGEAESEVALWENSSYSKMKVRR